MSQVSSSMNVSNFVVRQSTDDKGILCKRSEMSSQYTAEQTTQNTQGMSLRKWLNCGFNEANKPERLQIYRQIVQVVDMAHSQGNALQDLRLSNFILFPSNEIIYFNSSAQHQVVNFMDQNYRKNIQPGPESYVTVELEKNWYACPEELYGSDLLSANIYSLGILLFELLGSFIAFEMQYAVMSDLRNRILPPSFIYENPQEAGFCLWLLHPNPASRPTTRENSKIRIIKLEQRFELKCTYASTIGTRGEECRYMSQLESAYFSKRARLQPAETVSNERNDLDLLGNRKMCYEKNFGCTNDVLDDICKFMRYRKFKVCGSLKNENLLNSSNAICSLSFDHDENYIAAAGVSNKIKIYEFESLLHDSVDVKYPAVELLNKSEKYKNPMVHVSGPSEGCKPCKVCGFRFPRLRSHWITILKLWDLKQTSLEGISTDACCMTYIGHTNEKNFVGLSVLDGYIACGSESNEVKGCGEASCDSLFSSPIQGYMLGVLSACLSALAGVFTEFIVKKTNDTLYWQNVQLYTFGALFNMGRLFADDFRGGFESGPWWSRLFNGYTITTWLVVLNLGSTGLLVSWLMKYADNIVKGILTTLSQSDGGYKYDYATIPFLAEIFKLLVSSIFLWRECKKSPPPRMTTDWKTVRLYPIPSIIYLIHNNVQFATLTYVDTSTYQIMGNLKIVTTGILFRLFLKRKLSNLQWMAIVLLAVGTTTSQVKGCGEASCDSLFSSPIQGYMLGVLSACLSALAGVYTEFIMKKNNDTLYWQNVQLYTFGALFNMGRLFADDFRGGFENGPWWSRLFNGYTITTWLVVLNLGSTGLLVSWLMKYADNIVKVSSFLLD
ncbi:CMP-sialic acid transporter 1 [Tanacetum coccineum]